MEQLAEQVIEQVPLSLRVPVADAAIRRTQGAVFLPHLERNHA